MCAHRIHFWLNETLALFFFHLYFCLLPLEIHNQGSIFFPLPFSLSLYQKKMDISEEVRAAHKCKLMGFLEDGVCIYSLSLSIFSFSLYIFLVLVKKMVQLYMDEVKVMINHKSHCLIVNISDLYTFVDFGLRLVLSFLSVENPGK